MNAYKPFYGIRRSSTDERLSRPASGGGGKRLVVNRHIIRSFMPSGKPKIACFQMAHYNTIMYIFASQFVDQPVLSLQTGTLIAKVQSLVINPDKLELIAFHCFAPESELDQPILAIGDVRQLATDCILIDSSEELAEASDIVRLQKLLEQGFDLNICKAYTEDGGYLGKVADYSINTDTARVQRIHIHPQLLKRFLADTFIIEREQIVDVKPGRITVRDATVPLRQAKPMAAPIIGE